MYVNLLPARMMNVDLIVAAALGICSHVWTHP